MVNPVEGAVLYSPRYNSGLPAGLSAVAVVKAEALADSIVCGDGIELTRPDRGVQDFILASCIPLSAVNAMFINYLNLPPYGVSLGFIGHCRFPWTKSRTK